MQTRSGNPARDQFIYSDAGSETFVSYGTNIVRRSCGEITLDSYYWDFSRTTGAYRNQFLGEGIEETRKKIKAGTYKLADLNH
jgi:hypothetical protein